MLYLGSMKSFRWRTGLVLSYTFTPIGYVVFYGAMALGLGLLLSRNDSATWQSIPVLGAYDWAGYMSNFSISLLVMLAAGMTVLHHPRVWLRIGILASVVLALNVLFELLGLRLLNTPDWHDMVAGVVGVVLGFVVLVVLQRYGTKPTVT